MRGPNGTRPEGNDGMLYPMTDAVRLRVYFDTSVFSALHDDRVPDMRVPVILPSPFPEILPTPR
jgi:hypothetical protein